MSTLTLDAPPIARPLPVALSVQVLNTSAELDALQHDWDTLFAASPAAAAPLRFTWVRQWWETFGPIYGDHGRGLRIVTFRRGDRLVGVLPLYLQLAAGPLRLRRLRFISTGAAEFEETCAEYLGLLHAPGEADACIDELAPLLLDPPPSLRWDELRLDDMAETSPLLRLTDLLSAAGTVHAPPPGVAYLSNLIGGLEAYLMRLSPGTRKKARKFLRDLELPNIRFEIAATPQQAGEFFDQMVELHHQRWERDGKTGSFSPRHAAFHRAVAVALTESGQTQLARLTENGRPLAFTYGYRAGATFEAYQMGVTRDPCSIRSAGTAVFLGLAAHLAAAGVTTYDHLMGNNRFKMDYAKDQRPIRCLRIERHTWRMAAARRGGTAIDHSKQAVRQTLKLLRTRLCGTPAPAELPPAPAAASEDES